MIVSVSHRLAVAAVLLAAASTALAKPPAKPSAKSTAATVATIAKQVRQIERQGAKYTKLEMSTSILRGLMTGSDCSYGPWAAYLQNGQLRKVVVDAGQPEAGWDEIVEFYFSRGRLICVVTTDFVVGTDRKKIDARDRFYFRDGRVISTTTTRLPRERVQMLSPSRLRACERHIFDAVKRAKDRPRPEVQGVLT